MPQTAVRTAWRVRNATLRDVPLLVRQRRCMFEDMGEGDRPLLDQADREFARWMRAQWRARRLVGFLAVDARGRTGAGGMVWLQERQPRPGFAGGGVPYLMSMYTEHACRRQGLATMIITAALDWCRAHGHQRLSLHASPAGEPLYRGLGWKRTREFSRPC
jgi:GNAT superfamily N-acetyltransferase